MIDDIEDPWNENELYDCLDLNDFGDLSEFLEEHEELTEQQIWAAHCTCGAWILNSDGLPLHVGDCSCGAQEANY
ncbi:MAG: hypothetical protein J0M18_19410 [Ignavibacteria bacterium]|nr:hypothetical protein [Ignavibacteria bacterium]